MSKIYYRANEFRDGVVKAKTVAFERGMPVGFHTLHENISFKLGYTTYLYSFPGVGKTTFVNDILLNLAKTKGLKTAIYSPESGTKESIVASLIQTYLGKKMYGSNKSIVSVEEYMEAIDFIDGHFVIFEPNLSSKEANRFSFKEIFNTVHKAQSDYGWKIDMLIIDPFNFVQRDKEDDRLQMADYALQSLMFVTDASRKMNMHTVIVTHLQQDELITDKDTGTEYSPKPHPSKIAGGQAFWRTAFMSIGLWKCPYGVTEKATGMPYPKDAIDVMVQKAKPFGAGAISVTRMLFDDSKQRYYEEVDGKDYYIGEYEAYFNNTQAQQLKTKQLQPSKNWYDTETDVPF